MFDMFSASRKVAAQYREIFESLTAMGFTEEQAMQILIAVISVPLHG
jgi:hypothetical protein